MDAFFFLTRCDPCGCPSRLGPRCVHDLRPYKTARGEQAMFELLLLEAITQALHKGAMAVFAMFAV